MVLASLIMGCALWFMASALASWFDARGDLTRAAALAALVATGLIVYALIILISGAVELRQLRGYLQRARPPA
jgi:putative peptidoglycan lipid II flippase